MWLQRVSLSFVLVVLLGCKVPQIVHDNIPFNAEGVKTENISCKFARSKMINFFEYQITYDLNVTVNMTRLKENFAHFVMSDELNRNSRIGYGGTMNVLNNSVLVETHNTTISTIRVSPLKIKGGFVFSTDGPTKMLMSDESGFQVLIPGADPVINPLLVSLTVIYLAAVVIGFFIELTGPVTPDEAGELYVLYKQKTFWQKIKNTIRILVTWMITLFVVVVTVVIIVVKYGVVPSFSEVFM